jgi:hypothetical protein
VGRYKAIHRCKTSIGVVPASFKDPAGKNDREVIIELPDDEAKAFGEQYLAPATGKDVTWPPNGAAKAAAKPAAGKQEGSKK